MLVCVLRGNDAYVRHMFMHVLDGHSSLKVINFYVVCGMFVAEQSDDTVVFQPRS